MNELPVGWAIIPLQELVDILDANRIPLNAGERAARIAGKSADELFPYYGATGRVGEIDSFLFDEPLILLGEDGVPFLDPMRPKAYRVSGKCWVNNHAHVLRARVGIIDERFVAAFLNAFDYTGLVTGSTRLKLTQGAMRGIQVPLPPLPEQKRIADKLDAVLARVDACRERLDRVPGILKRFRQAVLAAATSGVLTEGWRGERNRSHESWIEMTGAEAFPFITSGSRGWAEFYSESGATFLRVGNLDHDTIVLDLRDVQYVTPPQGAEGRRTRINLGDIVISITADVGMVGFVSTDLGEAYINQHLCLARPTESCSGQYLAYFLASPTGGVAQLMSAQRGATKSGLTLGDIRDLEIRVPELDEQREIVRRVEQLFSYADHLEARYTAARAQIDRLTPALLAKAFRGELVPQDPNDEPASILLELISATRSAAEATASPKKQRRPNATAPTPRDRPTSEPTNGHAVQLPMFAPERNQTNGNGGDIEEENLLAALRAIVRGEREGLTETELLRGAASRLGYERLGKSIRTALESTLATALHRRVVALEDDRYVAATPTIARYDDAFLVASLSAIMRSDYEYRREEVAGMMAGYLGYSAVTDAMQERMKGVVAEGLRVGVLRGKGGWVWRETEDL